MIMQKTIKQFTAVVLATSILGLSGCAATDIKNIVDDGSAVSTSTKKLHPVSASKVRLYYSSSEYPKHYQVVGQISAENYSMVGIEHSQTTIANELKKQAGSIGANGVININSGLAQTVGTAIIRK